MTKKSILLDNGYDLFENLSFFQKSIREGKVEQALYWGHYLFREKSYATNAFRRMRIITHEDIGFANPEAIILIDEIHNSWKNDDWDERDDRYWKSAIKYLSLSNKNKENDWFLIMGKYHIDHGWEPEKESNLIDSLKSCNDGDAFYYAYMLRKKEPKALWTILKDSMIDDQFMKACYNSYLECKDGKGADGFYTLGILYISRNWYNLIGEINIDDRIDELLDDIEEIDIPAFKPVIPDYYYDMHTYKGKTRGHGFEHWYRTCRPHPYVEMPDEKHRINESMLGTLDEYFRKRKT